MHARKLVDGHKTSDCVSMILPPELNEAAALYVPRELPDSYRFDPCVQEFYDLLHSYETVTHDYCRTGREPLTHQCLILTRGLIQAHRVESVARREKVEFTRTDRMNTADTSVTLYYPENYRETRFLFTFPCPKTLAERLTSALSALKM